MCLAVPMLIDSVAENGTASVSMAGVTHTVNVTLIDAPQPGEYVIIHAGFAIERLNVEEAEARLELFGELAEIKRKAESQ